MNILDEYKAHFLLYGAAGTEKTRFLATLPKPLLVFFWDPIGKDFPYLRRGRPQPVVQADIPSREIWHPKEDISIIRLEYYQDRNYDIQQIGKVKRSAITFAYEKLLARFQTLEEEILSGQWASVVIDSISSLEMGIRKLAQYKLNPASNAGERQDARQWYYESSDQLLELMYSRIAWLPCVVGVAAHIKIREDRVRGELLYLPDFPGAVPHRAPGAFSECYYSYIDEEGVAWLQTQKSEKYVCCSQIPAPAKCEPTYKALFAEGV